MRAVGGICRVMLIAGLLGGSVVTGPVANADECQRIDGQSPCLTFQPETARPGTRVTFSGFVDDEDIKQWWDAWKSRSNIGMYRDFPAGGPVGGACELLVSGGNLSAIHLNVATGRVTGSFVVGTSGNCNQTQRSYPTSAGLYYLTAECVACGFAQYRVTASRLPATGGASPGFAAFGLLLIAAGSLLIGAARRRDASS